MRRKPIETAIAAAALIVTLLAMWRGVNVNWSPPDLGAPAAREGATAEDAKKHPDDERAKRATARNIFAPPKPKGFRGKLTGILGDQAIFNGSQLGKVGQTVSGAKILDMGPDWVEIEFEGKKQKLWVFQPRK